MMCKKCEYTEQAKVAGIENGRGRRKETEREQEPTKMCCNRCDDEIEISKSNFFDVVVVAVAFVGTAENVQTLTNFLLQERKKTCKPIKNRYAEDKVKVNCLNGFIAFYSLLSSEVFSSFHVFNTPRETHT